ncbi:MAG: hypothetical protein A2Y54_03325 [Chloroflexi bacterium RBG_16_51_16]|nr:MAG: hypothetical protein A2Y54_03325 [Chloroflexi bacterium RBG_16_51_16]
MSITEERMKILRMIEGGKITAEEGAKLLAALSEGQSSDSGSTNRAASGLMLRIRVTDVNSGRTKANVQLPLSMIDAGLKIGARFIPEVEGVDMSNVMNAVRSGVTGKIVDMTDEMDGEHVEIYIE